jgi:RimJ/RimL family protein N-acetyltransferase
VCSLDDDQDTVVPVLTDAVVQLDALRLSDAEAHWAGEDDEHARRFGWYPRRSTLEGVRAYIVRCEAEWRDGGARRTWAVRPRDNTLLLGGCELRLQGDGTAHMSWWVFPAYRRRGIATRAARLVAGYAFDSLGVRLIEARVEPDNLASIGVTRNVGFTEVDEVLDGHTRYARLVLLPAHMQRS